MSENAVMVREEITEKKITEYMDSAGITRALLPNEKKMFFNIAREFGLNPFKKEIHITAYGEGTYRKCSIITGYEVYLKRAEMTGKLDGWEVRYEGEGKGMKAVVTIHRKDQKYPFVHEAYYAECCQYNKEGQPNAIWAKMPKFMTKKVAIGQAFRLCFPNELGGMPYDSAETIEDEDVLRNVTEPHYGEGISENQINDDTEYLGKEIGRILKYQNRDMLPVFTEKEIEIERAVFKKAVGIEEIREQYLRLNMELNERLKNYKAVPFDDIPAAKQDTYEDDIF